MKKSKARELPPKRTLDMQPEPPNRLHFESPEGLHYEVILEGSRKYTANDVSEIAGLTYRQLNQWDSKGALPTLSRGSEAGWRKFTLSEVFVLMVLAAIRERFGVPVESLAWLREHMEQEGSNHLLSASTIMASQGVAVYMVTDLRETFLMESDVELGTFLERGAFGGNDPAGYIWLKVNDLVNRCMAQLDEPLTIEAHGLGYDMAALKANEPDVYIPSKKKKRKGK